MKKIIIFLTAGMLWISTTLAGELITCFTPGEKCTDLIVKQIDEAKKSIYIQAYGFTSQPIIEAVANAKNRGLVVKIILDKVNETEQQGNGAKYLRSKNIEVLIDNKVAIAHNKIMVIDERNIITGSFNFTKSAQDRNAENVLIILDDSTVANKYITNWEKRATFSRKLKD
jgi:phosphatidylserine/phosphatidylglycerophosphate/cardiolipin synthase-like enzyme